MNRIHLARTGTARTFASALFAIAALMPGAAWPQEPVVPTDAMAKVQATLQRIRQGQGQGQMPSRQQSPLAVGMQAERHGDWPEALARYEEAVDSAGASFPGLAEVQLRSALPAKARAALALGKLDVAEAALTRLDALPPLPQPAGGRTGFDQVARSFAAVNAFAQANSLALEQRSLVDGDPDIVATYDAARVYRLPSTDVPVALWAELRARQGRTEDVIRLWKQEFPGYLARDAQLRRPEAASLLDVPAVAAWHVALALEAVHAHELANEALHTALSLNRDQMVGLTSSQAIVDLQLGSFQQQRWMATSALELALRSGRPADAELAVGAIASAKLLTNRFIERRGALLAAMDDRASRRARASMNDLDSQLLQSSTRDSEGAQAWLAWTNGYAEALRPLAAALARAGLTDVFEPVAGLQQRLRGRLKAGEALIGYLQYQPAAAIGQVSGGWRYARYCLTAEAVAVADAGSKAELDHLVQTWRREHEARARSTASAALAAALLRDLPRAVQASSHWIIDPDGLLTLLPFEALPDGTDGLVLDHRSVRYLSFPAQLTDPQAPVPNAGRRAVILADPVYPAKALVDSKSLPQSLAREVQLRDIVLQPLPETRAEAAAVSQALKKIGVESTLLLGGDATPTALREVEAPAFLHVASHGYVLAPMVAGDTPMRVRSRMVVPGMLAGLILSPDRSGAVFTGIDLASMNLHGTRLVVLSACDTGNGSQDVHEGVSSLRRAAEEAGARATVTSLWAVPSEATTRLMADFYEQLDAGASNSDALRKAKIKARQAGASIDEWAGFVLAGAEQ